MPTTSVRDISISWSETGEGPTVVYAHGLTSSRANDQGTVDWSPVAGSGHRLIAYDARGHGLSTGSANPDDYEWPEMANDLIALLREIAPGEKVTGIGLSMGTATMIHAVTAAPELFDRLILTAVPTAWETRSGQSKIYNMLADLIEKEGIEAFMELMASNPAPQVFADLDQSAKRPDIEDANLPAVLRGAGRSDLPDETLVASIAVPVFILAWAGDPGHPVSSAQRLHELIDGSQLVIANTPAEFRAWGELAADFIRG
jgi:3-oxoadipate enol-lactonase